MGGNRGWVEGSTCKGGKGRHGLYHACILYSGYFSGGKIFVVFVVERQTTNFLPTTQYCIVLDVV